MCSVSSHANYNVPKIFCIMSFSCYDCLLSAANTNLPGRIGLVKLACVFLVLLLNVFGDAEQKFQVEALVIHVLVNIKKSCHFRSWVTRTDLVTPLTKVNVLP